MEHTREQIQKTMMFLIQEVRKQPDLLESFRTAIASSDRSIAKPRKVSQFLVEDEFKTMIEVVELNDLETPHLCVSGKLIEELDKVSERMEKHYQDFACFGPLSSRMNRFLANMSMELEVAMDYAPEFRTYESEENHKKFIFSALFDLEYSLKNSKTDDEFFENLFECTHCRPAFFVRDGLKRIGAYVGMDAGFFIDPFNQTKAAHIAKMVGRDVDSERLNLPTTNIFDFRTMN